ncbi:MAG: TIGR04086 family membrane protein [Eubacteriales bacterium]|nr:TIGR04086 family membrane protein [Eubacteriales bacterium]
MKKVKTERNVLQEKSDNKALFSLAKGTVFAYFITIAVFITYGILLTYTDMTEVNLQMVVMITTVVAVLVSGFISARGVNSRGLIYGMLSGAIYAIIMIMIGICVLPAIQFTFKLLMILILSICGCGVVGRIG